MFVNSVLLFLKNSRQSTVVEIDRKLGDCIVEDFVVEIIRGYILKGFAGYSRTYYLLL